MKRSIATAKTSLSIHVGEPHNLKVVLPPLLPPNLTNNSLSHQEFLCLVFWKLYSTFCNEYLETFFSLL